jgi:solute:Na+ symporter, SSS family
MHVVDLSIFVLYMVAMLGMGYYFMRRNINAEDYYLAGRDMGSVHIGLSVVATDVGGGFSIGLGGLGFLIGIAGSWMLFTGLIGAWLAAVLLIPHVKGLSRKERFYTFPQLFNYHYGPRVALLAGIISAIGYLGFTSSQMLAGAKLASASFVTLDLQSALMIMGLIIVVYTVMGGLKAVIYTDTIQWTILMLGLIGIGIPVAYVAIGGMDAIRAALGPEFFSLTNVSWQTLVNWGVTIIPIWFVGMTLYQRIYASRDVKEAKKAWFIAGLFEWPVMAFMGVLLGLFARVGAEQGMFAMLGHVDASTMDAEMGLPLLLRTVLPVGLMGLMMAAYFSAIMSTADSCLMAASGNVVTDILGRFFLFESEAIRAVRISQGVTLALGAVALLLASTMENVLELMLYSYAFMVSGLFVPVVGTLFLKRPSAAAAFWAMLGGGTTTLTLIVLQGRLITLPWGLDPNIFGITLSAIIYGCLTLLATRREPVPAG